jgi:hypothetical protein
METRLVRSIAIVLIAVGCSKGGRSPESSERTTLGTGAVVIDNDTTSVWRPGDAWKTVVNLEIGAGDQRPSLGTPAAITVDTSGDIYVLSREAQEIKVFDSTGQRVRTFGGRGEEAGKFTDASGMDWDRR